MKKQQDQKKIVCLGGGIGTVNLLRGLKQYTQDLTAIVSMADEGGSAGRLRRLYNILPPGDVISCLAALSPDETYAKLLKYRFPGDRYGKDAMLSGHKLGNLMLVAACEITGDFEAGIALLKKLFSVKQAILPATSEHILLSAITVDGKKIIGEEKIDLGKYNGKRVLEKIAIWPENPTVPTKVVDALEHADVIIAGPGDLYTTILPVLIIPKIKEMLMKSRKTKCFIINVANKPFETKGYKVSAFIKAITNHLGVFPFDYVFINNNFSIPIPKKYHYSYVKIDLHEPFPYKPVSADVVDEAFPLYHDHKKLAETIYKAI